MTDTPTPERVGELLEEWRADKAAGGYEANSYDLAQHLADEYGPLAESWQRQRAEIEALTALVRELEWRPVGFGGVLGCPLCGGLKGNGHEPGCRARLAATGESDD